MSGYTYCRCLECFEIVASDDMENPDFCFECEEAECDGVSPCSCIRGDYITETEGEGSHEQDQKGTR